MRGSAIKVQAVFFLFLSCATLLAGCGKDKTAQEFSEEQVSKDLAKYQAIAGTYRGTVVRQQTGAVAPQVIGSLEISLTALRNPNSDGGSAAGLIGTVRLFNANRSSVTFSNARYYLPDDSTQGSFSAKATLQTRDDGTATIAISGTISGGTFTGMIRATDRSGPQGNFTVVKDDPLPGDGQHSTFPGAEDMRTYAGTFPDPFCSDPKNREHSSCRNRRKPGMTDVKMSVILAAPSAEETFLNYFSDQKRVTLALLFDRSANAILNNAELDDRAGTIRFQGIVQGTTPSPTTLACNPIGRGGYHCTYSTAISQPQFDIYPQH